MTLGLFFVFEDTLRLRKRVCLVSDFLSSR